MYHQEKSKHSSRKASELIQSKLLEVGGTAVIPLLNGEPCEIVASKNGFISDKLNNYNILYEFSVFDVITDLLVKQGGKAKKGNGRGPNDKVGLGKCSLDTVVGYIARQYAGVELGKSCFDPVFVLAAVMEWAGAAYNRRGYIELAAEFKNKI